jgi:TonB family protein
MKPTVAFILFVVLYLPSSAADTLYFRLASPYNSQKSEAGEYLRKAIFIKDSGWLAWDFNDSNRLVARGFFTDTNFHVRDFTHYFYSAKGFCRMMRTYHRGKLEGLTVAYGEKGDTLWKQVFANHQLISTWTQPGYTAKEVTYIEAEQDAEYPGGLSRWGYYLSKNLKYPKDARNKEIMGMVVVLFVVSSKGEVTEVEVTKSVDPSLDKEAMRLIRASPKWTPASWDGIKVAQYKAQPVIFRLE